MEGLLTHIILLWPLQLMGVEDAGAITSRGNLQGLEVPMTTVMAMKQAKLFLGGDDRGGSLETLAFRDRPRPLKLMANGHGGCFRRCTGEQAGGDGGA